MSEVEKRQYLVRMLACPLVWAAVAPCIGLAVDWFLNRALTWSSRPLVALLTGSTAFGLAGLAVFRKMRKAVRASIARFEDPAYRARLRELGMTGDVQDPRSDGA